jgi:YaiO family outer membrane protein
MIAKHCLIALLFSLLVFSVEAQQPIKSNYEKGREAAFSGDYTLAITYLQRALVESPNDYDSQAMLARVYYWKQQPDSALLLVEAILPLAQEDAETQLLYLQLLLAESKAEKMLAHYQQLQPALANKQQFRFQQILALEAIGQEKAALDSLEKLLVNAQGLPQARAKLHQLQRKLVKHKIGAEFDYSTFDVALNDWYGLALTYERKLASGPLQFKIQSARRFAQEAAQLEVDFYPMLGQKTTAYVGFGLSNNTLFPAFRGGAELYHSLQGGWELSGGLRYLNFSNDPITTYTFSATKYLGNYYLHLRPFVIPYRDNIYVTAALQMRRYLSESRHYLGASIALGNSPDMDFRLNGPDAENINPGLYLLQAFSIRLDYQQAIRPLVLIKPFLEFRNEEFRPGDFRSRYSLGLAIYKSF